MANLSEDIQCAGSDTRPPMLDRTDFASWQQRIRLYCRGKENGVNILKSIDEGPFRMGTFRETLTEGTEGAPNLGPERPRVYSDLSPEDKERYNADIRATNILLQGLPKDIYSLINHYTDAKDIWDNVKMLLEGSELTKEDRESNFQGRHNRGQGNNARGGGAAGYGGAQNRVRNANPAQENGVALDEEQLLFIAGGQDNVIDEDVDEQPVQDLALNVENVFQADDCDAFDSDVDDAPMAQTMFMANLSSVDPVYDEAGLSYDSNILSEVHDHDHYQDAVCEHHEEHEMHDDVQPNYVVDSHANYTSNSNMILYEQYVKDNAVSVVQSNVSSIPNDAYMMTFIDYADACPTCRVHTRNTVVGQIYYAELATFRNKMNFMKDGASLMFLDLLKWADAHTIIEARCLELEAELSNLRDKIQNDNHNELVKMETRSEVDRALDFRALDFQITQLTEKVTITRAKHIEQTTALTTENENLKAQMQTKIKSVTKDHVKPTVLAPGKHLKESVETLREIVEEAKVERTLDSCTLSSASSSSSALQSPSLHQGVAADSTLMEDNPFALVDNHPFINVFALKLLGS
ncbi:hypothetical protein Tco_1253113 [Tanacetum coccineum]